MFNCDYAIVHIWWDNTLNYFIEYKSGYKKRDAVGMQIELFTVEVRNQIIITVTDFKHMPIFFLFSFCSYNISFCPLTMYNADKTRMDIKNPN